jgi:2',3'-cyclic-nucleotide 2'-phosphodiesterase (5'-nucleotidase family)
MRRIIGILAFILAVSSSLLAQQRQTDTVTIIHWNDFHAQNIPFNFVPRGNKDDAHMVGGDGIFAALIKQLRTATPNTIALDGGDEVQGTPISSITNGRSQFDLLNEINPDAMVIGNHEFDYGMDSLRANMRLAKFPILCANVKDDSTGKTLGLKYIIKQVGEVKVGVIGVTSPDLKHLVIGKNLVGEKLLDMDETIDDAVKEIREKEHPNLLILLSHEGIDDDSAEAVKHPEINIIVGGHDHHALQQPKVVGHTLIVEAGSRGQYVGRLAVAIDNDSWTISGYKGQLFETVQNVIAPDPVVQKKVDAYEAVVNQTLSTVIGELKTSWSKEGNGGSVECNLGDFEADAFRIIPDNHADVAFVNTSGLRKTMEPGPIKIRDLWEINPFGNTLVYFTVGGDVFKKMMDFQATKTSLQISGIRYVEDSAKKLKSLTVGTKPVSDDAHYTIVTNNYITDHFADYFGFSPKEKDINFMDSGMYDRDAVIGYVQQQKTISTVTDGRIKLIP